MNVRMRKSIYALTPTERSALFDAFNALKVDGTWDKLVRMHAISMSRSTLLPGETTADTLRNAAHRGPAFLPWHRVFLIELEDALNAVAPAGTQISIPYWPWETEADPANVPLFTDAYLGQALVCNFGGLGAPGLCRVSTGPAAAWDTQRTRFQTVPGSNELATDIAGNAIPVLDADGDPTFVTGGSTGDFYAQFGVDGSGLLRWLGNDGALPPQAHVDGVLTYTVYDLSPWDDSIDGTPASGSFRNRLEGWAQEPGEPPESKLHNVVHVWIDGDMGPSTSPNDPAFFLHHCNVDRIWARWQELRLETNPSYASDYLPHSGGPTGHNIDNPMFPWNGDPKFPGLATWTPRDTLDSVEDMGFLYDDVPHVSLRDTNLVFGDVISGETMYRAATFDIVAAYPVQLTVQAFAAGGSGFFRPPSEPEPGVVTTAAPTWSQSGFVWFAYEGGSGTGAPVTAQIRAQMSLPGGAVVYDRVFTVTMSATTIARPSVATALVLDQSASMSFDAGNGNQRIDVLHFAAPPFVELLDAGNGIGVVAFDHDPHERMDVLPVPGATGGALTEITNHMPNPMGNTSIADGIELARTKLDAVASSYDDRAMVVLTDGHETAPKWLSELDANVLDGKVFAVGLGTPEHIQPERLADIAGSHDGYLLLTGELATDGSDDFLLSKYYLQILAGLTNMQVALDPEGWVRVGEVRREAFELSEADIRADVVLLTKSPFLEMRLEAPSGEILAPSSPTTVIEGQNMLAYRVGLPAPTPAGPAHAGTWHALLRLDPRRVAEWLRERLGDKHLLDLKAHSRREREHAIPQDVREAIEDATRNGVRYSLVVHTWSNLRMDARLQQSGHEPGATARLRAILTEYGIPVLPGTQVNAHVQRPDRSETTVPLAEVEPGIFEGEVRLSAAGAWRFRVVTEGRTRSHLPVTREQLLTASVRRGGDQPSRPPSDGLPPWVEKRDEAWCRTLICILENEGVRAVLERHHIDPRALLKCLVACKRKDGLRESAIAEVVIDPAARAAILARLAAALEGG